MPTVWSHRFEVSLRPLRDVAAAPMIVVVETRTAAQAARDAATRHPGMKIVAVQRLDAPTEE